jgi:hypothetical protein
MVWRFFAGRARFQLWRHKAIFIEVSEYPVVIAMVSLAVGVIWVGETYRVNINSD